MPNVTKLVEKDNVEGDSDQAPPQEFTKPNGDNESNHSTERQMNQASSQNNESDDEN